MCGKNNIKFTIVIILQCTVLSIEYIHIVVFNIDSVLNVTGKKYWFIKALRVFVTVFLDSCLLAGTS